MIDRTHPLPVIRQCQLLNLNRSSAYYGPLGVYEEDLRLLRLIDKIHLKRPFYGSRQIRIDLQDLGHPGNRKKVQRLMRQMGIMALYPKSNTSRRRKGHKIYPYLLKGLTIDRPNQVWATDLSYILMAKGFVYVMAILDWYSRKVLAWRVSDTMDAAFGVDSVEEAISRYGAPDIFNTDQSAQFTSDAFTGVLKEAGVRISMDGKGRCVDNVFVERLWRRLKYEEVYLKAYDTVAEARFGIGNYFRFWHP